MMTYALIRIKYILHFSHLALTKVYHEEVENFNQQLTRNNRRSN